MIRLVNQGYEEGEMFGIDVETMLATNKTIMDYRAQFEAMQKLLIDLEHRVEKLETELKNK